MYSLPGRVLRWKRLTLFSVRLRDSAGSIWELTGRLNLIISGNRSGNDRGEIGKGYAQREVGADVLPGGGEVAGDQAQKAEKDGGPAVDVNPEI
jgi:hypothetical protein